MKLEKFITKPEKEKSMREILKDFPKEDGRYYHGSHLNLDELLPPDETGNIRIGEEGRRLFKDVVFLTKNIDQAIKYAGPGGTIHHVNASAARYKEVAAKVLNIKKAKTVSDDVFIALPEDMKMIGKWVKEPNRKKNEPELYTDYYVGD